MTQPPSHPEFDDQVRSSSVAEFLEIADRLAGGQVGFPREGACRTCGHEWLPHSLFMLRDDEQTAGYISCPVPACECSTTWGLGGAVPPIRCELGLTIRTAEGVVLQCPNPAGGLLMVERDDLPAGGTLDVPMCTEHLVAMSDEKGRRGVREGS